MLLKMVTVLEGLRGRLEILGEKMQEAPTMSPHLLLLAEVELGSGGLGASQELLGLDYVIWKREGFVRVVGRHTSL